MGDGKMKVDYKKLVEQEPQFKDYLEQALVKLMLSTKDGQNFIKSVHSFYQIGTSLDDLSTWFNSIKPEEDN